jgi:hypothetical protein
MRRFVPASTSDDVWAEQVLLQIAKPHHFDLCLAQIRFEMSADKESWQDADDKEANGRRLTDMIAAVDHREVRFMRATLSLVPRNCTIMLQLVFHQCV